MNELIESMEIEQDHKKMLVKLKGEFNVSEERIVFGYNFASLINEGFSRVEAYQIAFGVDKKTATSCATNLFRAKWIQKLMRLTVIEDEILYKELRSETIKTLTDIANSAKSTTKETIDAIKTLTPLIREQKQSIRIDTDITIEPGVELMQNILLAINNATSQNKMISQKGELIDVKIIE